MGKNYEQASLQKRAPKGQSSQEEVLSNWNTKEVQIKPTTGSHERLKYKSRAEPSTGKGGATRPLRCCLESGREKTAMGKWCSTGLWGSRGLPGAMHEWYHTDTPAEAHTGSPATHGQHRSIVCGRWKLETRHVSISSRVNKVWFKTQSSREHSPATRPSKAHLRAAAQMSSAAGGEQTLRSAPCVTPRCERPKQVKWPVLSEAGTSDPWVWKEEPRGVGNVLLPDPSENSMNGQKFTHLMLWAAKQRQGIKHSEVILHRRKTQNHTYWAGPFHLHCSSRTLAFWATILTIKQAPATVLSQPLCTREIFTKSPRLETAKAHRDRTGCMSSSL